MPLRTTLFNVNRPIRISLLQQHTLLYTLSRQPSIMSTLRQRPSASAPDATPRPALARAQSSHSHNHSHGGEEAAALLAAIKGSTDRGSRITLIGLAANVGLTGVKGVAGWVLGSAALLADAAHSGSDLLSDVVTLTTFRMSRRPVSASHPYGYGKYESLGSLVVSFLLIGTALGIGFHSYHLLLQSLSTIPSMNAALLASLDALPQGHSHSHHDGDAAELVDGRAMLFAGASVLVKEYLYRITLKVAKSEHSNVLLANALHHRSDAFGSLVALGAIGGAWLGFPVLDPLGGLLVAGMILKNGAEVGITALKELTDQVTDPSLPPKVHAVLLTLRDPSLPPLPSFTPDSSTSLSTRSHSHSPPSTPTLPLSLTPATLPILAIPSIRIFSSGPSFLVDIVLVLPSDLTLKEANEVERVVKKEVVENLGGPGRVREVVVRLKGEEAQ